MPEQVVEHSDCEQVMLFPDWERNHREWKRLIAIVDIPRQKDRCEAYLRNPTHTDDLKREMEAKLVMLAKQQKFMDGQLSHSEECSELQRQIIEYQDNCDKGKAPIPECHRNLPETRKVELEYKLDKLKINWPIHRR